MIKGLILTCALMLSSVVNATTVNADDYNTISNVEITQIGQKQETSLLYEIHNSPRMDYAAIIMAVDSIIAIGKKVWPIIEAGKPVLNTTGMLSALSVLPASNLGPRATLQEMANWSVPEVSSFKIAYKNKLGNTIASFVFSIYFQYNGSLNGKGKYLTSITTEASGVSAAWGFNLDAKSELISIANVGTAKNPVASAILKIGLKTTGKLNSVENSFSYYIDGRGNFKALH